MQDTELAWIAGLFDGEGHVSLTQQVRRYVPTGKNRSSIQLHICFSVGYDNFPILFERLSHLSEYGAVSANHNGKTYLSPVNGKHYKNVPQIIFGRWEENERIIELLLPFVLLKKRQLELAKDACLLHRKYSIGKNIVPGRKGFVPSEIPEHLPEFDLIRHELHSLAKKGKKQLKPWISS